MPLLLLLVAVFVILPMTANAQTTFGSKGTLAPNGAIVFSQSTTTAPDNDNSDSYDDDYDSGSSSPTSLTVSTIGILPQIDFFIIDNLSIGGGVQLITATSNSNKSDASITFTTTGIHVSIGYNLWANDLVSFYPKLSIGSSVSTLERDLGGMNGDMGGDNESSRTAATLSINAPFLFHFDNFFIGIGPQCRAELFAETEYRSETNDAATTTVLGIASTIGGWF